MTFRHATPRPTAPGPNDTALGSSPVMTFRHATPRPTAPRSLRRLQRTAVLVAVAVAAAATIGAACAGRRPAPDRQIRERLASIRTAILEKNADGIVRWGTDDWQFVGADGRAAGKADYVASARALMARIVAIDRLDTTVDRIDVHGDTADVGITQAMERRERVPATGAVQRLRLRYREQQQWVLAADGWRVRRVALAGPAERTVLPIE